MAKNLEKLVVKLEADIASYQKKLATANARSKKWRKSTRSDIAGVKSAFAALGAGIAVNSIIQATAKQEKAFRQLEQGIKSTQQAAGFAAKDLAEYASQLQSVTTFGDEDILGAMSQLVTFTNITGEQFKETTEAALNLSARMDQDLKTSVLQLGKALNDPIGNMGALSRSGIQFSEDQKQVIKSLAETGRLADAQKIILAELETQFGGSAKAARDTFGGAIEALGNAFGDLLESDTGLGAAKESIEELTKTLSDPAVKEGVNKLTGAIISGFAGAASLISTVTNSISFLAEEFAAWIHGPAVGDIPRIENELYEVQQKIEAIGDTTSRSNAESRYLKQLKAREATLQGLLQLSKEQLETDLKIKKIVTDGESAITGGSDDDSGGVDTSGLGDDKKKRQFKFINDPEKLAKYSELMNEYKIVSENAALYIEDSFVNSFARIADTMSSTLSSAIVEGESLADAFEQVGKTLAKDLVGGLIKVGTQMAINALFAQKTGAAITAGSKALAAVTASAWATPAAMVSLATFGGNAAPASAGIASTVALSNSLALTGMAHDGISSIPSEGTWLLDKGERVLSAQQNADLKQFLNSQASGAANDSSKITHLHFYGDVYGEMQGLARELKNYLDKSDDIIVSKESRNGQELRA